MPQRTSLSPVFNGTAPPCKPAAMTPQRQPHFQWRTAIFTTAVRIAKIDRTCGHRALALSIALVCTCFRVSLATHEHDSSAARPLKHRCRFDRPPHGQHQRVFLSGSDRLEYFASSKTTAHSRVQWIGFDLPAYIYLRRSATVGPFCAHRHAQHGRRLSVGTSRTALHHFLDPRHCAGNVCFPPASTAVC